MGKSRKLQIAEVFAMSAGGIARTATEEQSTATGKLLEAYRSGGKKPTNLLETMVAVVSALSDEESSRPVALEYFPGVQLPYGGLQKALESVESPWRIHVAVSCAVALVAEAHAACREVDGALSDPETHEYYLVSQGLLADQMHRCALRLCPEWFQAKTRVALAKGQLQALLKGIIRHGHFRREATKILRAFGSPPPDPWPSDLHDAAVKAWANTTGGRGRSKEKRAWDATEELFSALGIGSGSGDSLRRSIDRAKAAKRK